MMVPDDPSWGEHSTNVEPPQKRPHHVLPPSGPLTEGAQEGGIQMVITESEEDVVCCSYY